VVRALRAYQNPDGGFGHALEPDLRCPESQPMFVDFALKTLCEVDAREREIGELACDFLARVSAADGSVPSILPNALNHPRVPLAGGGSRLAERHGRDCGGAALAGREARVAGALNRVLLEAAHHDDERRRPHDPRLSPLPQARSR
jgi:hypothetical protein